MRTKCNRMDLIKNLNLWGNDLQDISVVQSMPNLEVLSLSVNHVATLADLQHCPKLSELYLRKNDIVDLSEILYLRHLRRMKVLWLADNPCADLPYYRQYILHHLPSLTKIDEEDVTEEERRDASMIDFGGVETCPLGLGHAGQGESYAMEEIEPAPEGIRRTQSESDESRDGGVPPQQVQRRPYEESPSRRPPAPRAVAHERGPTRDSGADPRASGQARPASIHSAHSAHSLPEELEAEKPSGMRRPALPAFRSAPTREPLQTPWGYGVEEDLAEQRRPPQRKNSRPSDPRAAAKTGLAESPGRGPGVQRRESEVPLEVDGRGGSPFLFDGQGGRPATAWGDEPAAAAPRRSEEARSNGVSRMDNRADSRTDSSADNVLCAVLSLVKELDRSGLELVRRSVEQRLADL